jgi:hypothetical protein
MPYLSQFEVLEFMQSLILLDKNEVVAGGGIEQPMLYFRDQEYAF